MANETKKNIFSRIAKWLERTFTEISERVNQIDIPNDSERFGKLNEEDKAELESLNQQGNVREIEEKYCDERKTFRKRLNEKVDPLMEKYGPLDGSEKNPIREVAERMNKKEREIQGREH